MIVGEKIILRALEEQDSETLRRWRNMPELFRNHCSHLLVSEIAQNRWFQNYTDDSNTIIFIISDAKKASVGYTLIKNLDHKNQKAEIGIYLDPKFQCKGYGKDAFRTLIQYAFSELNLHRLELEVFAFNEHAIAVYQKLGFKEDGRLREAFFTQNLFQDIVVMSLLQNEWPA